MLPKRKYISAFFPLPGQERTRSGNKVEMKRKNISALFPRRNVSKNSFEVLRLGLGRDPIRELPSGNFMWALINLSIEAPPPEWHPGSFGWRDSDDTREATSGIRRRALRRRMFGAELSDACVL